MPVRSFIGLEKDGGEVCGIYCHWNGSPSHNGKILLNYYSDQDKLNKLISLGDISSLGIDIGERQDWNNFNYKWTVAYHRDYDDFYNQENYGSLSTALNRLSCNGYDYMYIFSKNNWIFSSSKFLVWESLSKYIKNERDF